jgi:hypothetical protein
MFWAKFLGNLSDSDFDFKSRFFFFTRGSVSASRVALRQKPSLDEKKERKVIGAVNEVNLRAS